VKFGGQLAKDVAQEAIARFKEATSLEDAAKVGGPDIGFWSLRDRIR